MYRFLYKETSQRITHIDSMNVENALDVLGALYKFSTSTSFVFDFPHTFTRDCKSPLCLVTCRFLISLYNSLFM